MGEGLWKGPGLAVPAAALALPLAWAAAHSPLLALAAVAAIVLLALVTLNAFALLLVVVAGFPWDDALSFPSATFSLTKLLGALLLLAYLLRALVRGERLRVPPTLAAVATLVVLVLLSLLVAPDTGTAAVKAMRYVLFGCFFFLMVQLVRTPAELRLLLRVLALSTIAAATVGLVNFLTGKVARASGPIGEANDFAFLLGAVLPLIVYLAVSEPRRRLLWGLGAAVVGATMLATLSRGGLLGLGAMLVWALLTRRIRIGGAIAGLGVLFVAALAGLALWGPLIHERLTEKADVAQVNSASRMAFWSAAVRMSADHPLLGVGPGQFGAESTNYLRNDPIVLDQPVVHDSYLEVLVDSGIFALIAFVAFLAGSWRIAAGARRRARQRGLRDEARLASAIQAGMVGALVSAAFLSVQITPALWLLGGLAAVSAAVQPGLRPRP